MRMKETALIINDISLAVTDSQDEAFSVARSRLKKAGLSLSNARFSIYRRSVDARKKEDIRLVYSVVAVGNFPVIDAAKMKELHIALLRDENISYAFGNEKLSHPPVVVGAGPCGLFCALLLAKNGYAPIVLERGASVEERVASVARFHEKQTLDPETNVQFGAGGAGTFSDGKLITRLNDPHTAYILKTLVEMGADPDILTKAKPHVGTDVLRTVTENLIRAIEENGGRVLFHTKFLEAIERNGVVTAVKTSGGEIAAGALILAIGHSARDTYEALLSSPLSIEAKPFSVGMRIEHLTENIDRAMYGDFAGHPALGHAEYSLSHNTKVRGVYTFCMCPGGTVVAAASEHGGVVANGMSERARDGKNSNSAVVCSVFKEDYGAKPQLAIDFQRSIERAAFVAGGSDYSAPFCTVGNFLGSAAEHRLGSVAPTYMAGKKLRFARPESYLPTFVTENIRSALFSFDKKIEGFAASDALLTGAETRTSAPIRILRNPETHLALGYKNLYPGGEGAGYAGGITSAALDGTYIAISLMEQYAPFH